MEHKPYRAIVQNSDKAVLFIHGILGSPDHFDNFIPLIPREISAVNLLLEGHGKGVSDFSSTSMTVWRKQVEDTVEELLQTHKKVDIVAHSMGTLFAIEQAIVHKDRIDRLFLLAVPVCISLKFKMIANALKLYSGNIKPEDLDSAATYKACSITLQKGIFRYIGWIPRYLELFGYIRTVRKIYPGLSVPTVAYQSALDEMVSVKSVKLLQKNPNVQVHLLSDSSHFRYGAKEYAQLLHDFEETI